MTLLTSFVYLRVNIASTSTSTTTLWHHRLTYTLTKRHHHSRLPHAIALNMLTLQHDDIGLGWQHWQDGPKRCDTKRRDQPEPRYHFYLLFTGFTNIYTRLIRDDERRHDDMARARRRGPRFYSGATKGRFYMHISTFFYTKQCIYPPSRFYFCATTERTRFQNRDFILVLLKVVFICIYPPFQY